MRRSRKLLLFVLLPALVLGVALAPVALAYTDIGAHHQSGGVASLVDVQIYAKDEPAASVTAGGSLTVDWSLLRSDAVATALNGTGTVFADAASQIFLTHTGIFTWGELAFQGAQGVYSTGTGTVVSLSDCRVVSDGESARGLYTTSGGKIIANNVHVETYKAGGGAAAATSGTNGGTIEIDGGYYGTHGGAGSAVFYSTGKITVVNAIGNAQVAEGACVDGGSSLILNSCTFLRANANNGVSFAKSPLPPAGTIADGTSVLTMTEASLWAKNALFYAPNSNVKIALTNSELTSFSNVVLTTRYSGGGPGNDPDRGSKVAISCKQQKLNGDILSDRGSVVNLSLLGGSVFTGAINPGYFGHATTVGLSGQAAPATESAIIVHIAYPEVNLTIDCTSQWVVTADSFVSVLKVPLMTGRSLGHRPVDISRFCIQSCGYDVYYDDYLAGNAWLRSRVYSLPGGGRLIPWSLAMKPALD